MLAVLGLCLGPPQAGIEIRAVKARARDQERYTWVLTGYLPAAPATSRPLWREMVASALACKLQEAGAIQSVTCAPVFFLPWVSSSVPFLSHNFFSLQAFRAIVFTQKSLTPSTQLLVDSAVS